MSAKQGDLPEFDNPVTIDKYRLDEECERQAFLVRTWCEKLAEARLAWSDAKADLDVIKAETSKQVRDDPTKFGVSKVTVDSVADAVTTHPKVINQVKKVNRLKYEVDMIEAMTNALEHKKRMIEKDVDLYGMDYFAPPKQPKDPDVKIKFSQHKADHVAESIKTKGRKAKK